MKTIRFLVDQFYLHGGFEKLCSIKANYWVDKFGYNIILVSKKQQDNRKEFPLSDRIIFEDLNVNYHISVCFFHPKNLMMLSLRKMPS